MNGKSATDFLHAILEASGCCYLSDLHNARYAANVLHAIESIPAEDYDAVLWQEALRYITFADACYDTAGAYRDHLISHLTQTVRQ